jgi:hypothetical protein
MYDLEVPANVSVMIKVNQLEVDCPYDYVEFATDIAPNSVRLCPVFAVLPRKPFILL